MTDGWLRAGEDRVAHDVELARALAGRLEQLVAVVDGRLAPDEDALLVEAVQQARVEQVVRARDVHAERLELVDGVVDVGVGHRRAAAGDVLLDRGAAQVQHAVVEAQHPVADVDGAQPDVALVDLHDCAAGARRDRAGVAVAGARATTAFGSPLTGTAKRTRTRSPGRSARGAALPSETVAVGRLQADGDGGLLHGRRCGSPASRRRARSTRRSTSTQTRRGSRPASCMTTGAARDERDLARDPAPVPPALAQCSAAAVVDAHDERVRLARRAGRPRGSSNGV